MSTNIAAISGTTNFNQASTYHPEQTRPSGSTVDHSSEIKATIVLARTGTPIEQGNALRALDAYFGSRSATDIATSSISDPISNIGTPGVDGIKPSSLKAADFNLVGATKDDTAKFQKSLDYLAQSPTALALMQTAASQHATINIIHNGDDHEQNNQVFWDPNSALTTTSGGIQSAALGLVHEVDHLENSLPDSQIVDDPKYDNNEEKRVITGTETQIANDLHEPTRMNHAGSTFDVTDPTFNTPNGTLDTSILISAKPQ